MEGLKFSLVGWRTRSPTNQQGNVYLVEVPRSTFAEAHISKMEVIYMAEEYLVLPTLTCTMYEPTNGSAKGTANWHLQGGY